MNKELFEKVNEPSGKKTKERYFTRFYIPLGEKVPIGVGTRVAETEFFERHMRVLYQRMYRHNHALAQRNNQRLPYEATRRYKRRDEGAIIEYQNGHGLEELVVFDIRTDVLLCINNEGIVRELPHGLKRAQRTE